MHDFYRRFIRADASERHYVNTGRVCTALLYVIAALLSRTLDSAQKAFEILISIGAGTGLLYLLRWYWWRINAWCEIVGMIASFVSTAAFMVLDHYDREPPFAQKIIYTVVFATACWLIAAFVTRPTSDQILVAFYRKVHPAGPGWTRIRKLQTSQKPRRRCRATTWGWPPRDGFPGA